MNYHLNTINELPKSFQTVSLHPRHIRPHALKPLPPIHLIRRHPFRAGGQIQVL